MSDENRNQRRQRQAPAPDGESTYVVLLGAHRRKVGDEIVECGPGETITLDEKRGARLVRSGDVAPEGSSLAMAAQTAYQARLEALAGQDATGEPDPLRRG